MKILRYLMLFSMLMGLHGCSSSSQVAVRSTDLLGEYSPLGSREVTRKQQMTIASKYRVHIGYAVGGRPGLEAADLNKLERDSLARQIARYFAHISESRTPVSLTAALAQAYENNAQLLLYPRVAGWPNSAAVDAGSCSSNSLDTVTDDVSCAPGRERSQHEIVVIIAVYDVLSGTQIDSITARSRPGASSVYQDNLKELDLLNQLIVSKLTQQ